MDTRIGVALGSGSARGWAHIGILRALEAEGLTPSVVAGTSIGSLVGAAYVTGRLDALEDWVRRLSRRDVMGFLDVSLSGGLFAARRLFEFMARHFEDVAIEDLEIPFAAVAADLQTGQEIWIRHGSLMQAVRASIAIPGLLTPLYHGGRWLVDGGLVNPVPVSVCRALGAHRVVGVDLHSELLGSWPQLTRATLPPASPEPLQARLPAPGPEDPADEAEAPREADLEVDEAAAEAPDVPEAAVATDADADTAPANTSSESGETPGLWRRVQERTAELMARLHKEPSEPDAPSLFEVVAGALDVMQVRLSRSRLAGDPPDLLVTPYLPDVGLLDYHLAASTIEEGRSAVARALASRRMVRSGGDGGL